MANATHIIEYRSRSSNDTRQLARPASLEASRIGNGLRRIWRAVATFMRAVDRRLTENLEIRARSYRYGDTGRRDEKRCGG